MSEFKNEASKRLTKLNVKSSTYCLFVKNNDNEELLHFDVCGFPTTGIYHLYFTKFDGKASEETNNLLQINELSFNVNTIKELEQYTSITCIDLVTNKSYKIEKITNLGIKNEDDEDTYEDFKESINNNKQLKSSMEMLTKLKSGNYKSGELKPSLLSRIFSIFK